MKMISKKKKISKMKKTKKIKTASKRRGTQIRDDIDLCLFSVSIDNSLTTTAVGPFLTVTAPKMRT